jgi:hypothetical protein
LYDDRVLDWIDLRVDKWRRLRSSKLPEPAEFDSSRIPQPKIDLAEQFVLTGIQVFVQLETVFLNPPNAGGKSKTVIKTDWHIQGHMVRLLNWSSFCMVLSNTNSDRTSMSVQLPFTATVKRMLNGIPCTFVNVLMKKDLCSINTSIKKCGLIFAERYSGMR